MNGKMPSSDTFNNTYPSSNPGIVAYNYAKADQFSNPRNVGESLKEGYKPLLPKDAAWHRQGIGNEYNIKMVHPDGREAVYDKEGKLVLDPKNLGTRNDVVPNGQFVNDYLGHGPSDVVPYIFNGNTRSEPKGFFAIFDRIKAAFNASPIPDDYMQHWDHIYNPPTDN
jgi:hypothetical protein